MFISKSMRESQPNLDMLSLNFYATLASWSMLALIEFDEEERKAIK